MAVHNRYQCLGWNLVGSNRFKWRRALTATNAPLYLDLARPIATLGGDTAQQVSWANGTTQNVVMVGWSTDLGTSWAAVSNILVQLALGNNPPCSQQLAPVGATRLSSVKQPLVISIRMLAALGFAIALVRTPYRVDHIFPRHAVVFAACSRTGHDGFGGLGRFVTVAVPPPSAIT